MTKKPSPSLDERIVELEILCTHLQHDFQDLNKVVIDQQSQLDQVQKINEQLQQHIEELENPETRDPDQERPPHY